MKKLAALLILIFPLLAQANSNLLLDKEGADVDFSKKLNVRRQLELDDALLIQLYSSWKALGALEPRSNDWMQALFAKEYETALKMLPTISEGKIQGLKKPAELYLLYRLGFFQTFIDRWIDHTSKSNFLKTELGLALDQVVSPQSSLILINSGLTLTKEMIEGLKKTEGELESRLNVSLQAYKALRTGENAVEWIGRLDSDDELRLHLAHTALLAYGKKGMLGASGKLIKKVVEPWIEKSEKPEEIALYYMTLGRLLYQARAYEAAANYYQRIPETSKFFLQARTEYLWVLLQTRNFSKAMGELATLKLGVFEDQFYPEVYLVSAIGHTMVCQFTDARRSIHQFVSVNKKWAKLIEKSLVDEKAPLVEDNFYSNGMHRQLVSLKAERATLLELKKKGFLIDELLSSLERNTEWTRSELKKESQRQWLNRRKLLESSLYKMKFVRIELLSRMRAVAEGLKDQLPGQDMVKQFAAAPARTSKNEMAFPHDGMLWGDELFHMNADVLNHCIQGKFYDK